MTTRIRGRRRANSHILHKNCLLSTLALIGMSSLRLLSLNRELGDTRIKYVLFFAHKNRSVGVLLCYCHNSNKIGCTKISSLFESKNRNRYFTFCHPSSSIPLSQNRKKNLLHIAGGRFLVCQANVVVTNTI